MFRQIRECLTEVDWRGLIPTFAICIAVLVFAGAFGLAMGFINNYLYSGQLTDHDISEGGVSIDVIDVNEDLQCYVASNQAGSLAIDCEERTDAF